MKALVRQSSLFMLSVALGMPIVALPGCSTAPPSDEKKHELSQESHMSMEEIQAADPSLKDFLAKAYAYVVFPEVASGAVGVGGAYGRGEAYEQSTFVGYADLSQGTLGLQLGGKSYTEVIVFSDADSFGRFKDNKLEFAANASAVALKAGAAASAKYDQGIAVFTHPRGGLMFEAAIGAQQFTFNPVNAK